VYKVKVTVPATVTNLGPGLNVLGLALALHTTIDMHLRSDDELSVKVSGEDAERIPTDFDNPSLRAAIKVFQRIVRAPAGLEIDIHNQIPFNVGLGGRTALVMGGLIAAQNLTGNTLRRDQIIHIALDMGLPPESIITTIFGGLSSYSRDEDNNLVYRSWEIQPLRVVVVLPRLENYRESLQPLPQHLTLDDAIYNAAQTALLADALQSDDIDLLAQALKNRVYQENKAAHIPGYEAVCEAAYEKGALGVTISGRGPTLLAFAEDYHDEVAVAMIDAFADEGYEAVHWILNTDRQGVVLSVFE